jgi:hypothetical protein
LMSTSTESVRRLRAERRQKGVCDECGGLPLETKRHCAAHALAFRTRARDRKRMLRESGICDRCEKAPATICFKCAPCYEVHRAAKRKSEKKRIAAGICERCARPRTDARYCSLHRQDRRAIQHRARAVGGVR